MDNDKAEGVAVFFSSLGDSTRKVILAAGAAALLNRNNDTPTQMKR